ncbi:MAG: fatty acid desaturase [Candidatus Obscuribacterales bacterium]|nr:fatty acid desaturase [Candidatus Obscuribacterales bacterium]
MVSSTQVLDRPSDTRRFASSVPNLVRLPDHFIARQNFLAAFLVISNVAVVVGAGVLAYKLNTWYAYFLAFILVGARGQALNILQHEAMHYLLFTNKTANVVVGSVLSALIGTRYYDGRALHMAHHRYAGAPNDPNVVWFSTVGRQPGGQAAWFFLSQLIGIRVLSLVARLNMLVLRVISGNKSAPEIANAEAAVAKAAPSKGPKEATANTVVIDLVCLLACQFTVMVLIWSCSDFWVYPVMYVGPIVTLSAFFEAVRSFSEHVLPGEDAQDYADEHRLYYMHTSWIERFFFSQFSFHYHHIHHLYPNVPTFKMKEVHKWLCENDPNYRLRYKDRESFLTTAVKYTLGKNIVATGVSEMENNK